MASHLRSTFPVRHGHFWAKMSCTAAYFSSDISAEAEWLRLCFEAMTMIVSLRFRTGRWVACSRCARAPHNLFIPYPGFASFEAVRAV
jgi:hypothetical protein